MQFPVIYLLSEACYFAIWTALLANGIRNGRISERKLFYAWVVISAAAEAAAVAVGMIWGFNPSPWAYVHVYFIGVLGSGLLAAGLLVQIHRMIGKSYRSLIVSLGFAGLFLLDAHVSSESILYWLLVGTLHCFLSIFGAAAVWRLYRTPTFRLGRNYSAILAGIFFPSLLVALNHVAYLSRIPHWTAPIFGHLLMPIGIASWVVIYLGMRTYDPPSRGPEEDQERILREMKLRLKILRSWT